MEKITNWLLQRKLAACILIALVLGGGVSAYRNLMIDVFPDPSPVLVQVFTEAEGMAPEEVEKFVTYPVETSLNGLPSLDRITSVSTFGLSTVNVYFNNDIDLYGARALVSQLLPSMSEQLPELAEAPKLGPVSTGLGMVYVYTLEGNMPVMQLRTLQDWVVKYQLQTLPGVAAVLSHGGDIKQFHIEVDPDSLSKYGLDIHEIMERVRQGGRNVTAGFLVKNGDEYVVRGIGVFRGAGDLARVQVKESGATPVFLSQVARISVAPAVKRGEALSGKGDSVVSGIIMKLAGVNTAELIDLLNSRMDEINAGLPEGVRLRPVYNQGAIIKAAFRTVSEALLLGMLLVMLILLLFLNDVISSFVAALSIPVSVAAVFLFMWLGGITADLMSFGGLAIGIGLMVDATVVVVENIVRKRQLPGAEDDSRTVVSALTQVMRPLVYAMLIIVLAFLPILTLQGVEGIMFRPFGAALLVAIVAAIGYAVFVSPVLMKFMGSRRFVRSGYLFSFLQRAYLKIFSFFYYRTRFTCGFFALVFLLSLAALFSAGSEFIPRLNEQTLQLQTVLPQNTAIEKTVMSLRRIHSAIEHYPEIDTVYSRIGRGEAGTHAHAVNMGNTIIGLKKGRTWHKQEIESLIEKIKHEAETLVPGGMLNFTQPIRHNLDHLLTGVKADLAVKIFGADYHRLIETGHEIEGILKKIPGVADTQVSRVSGQNEVTVRIDRMALARYGLDAAPVLRELEVSFGGKTVAKVYEGHRVFDVFLRYAAEARKNMNHLNNLWIHTPRGGRIPLSSVARIEVTEGLSNISRENGHRYLTVQCNVRGRDIGSVVKDARKMVFSQIRLPLGYYLDWGGQFELKKRADKRLYVTLGITFVLILLLLANFLRSFRDVLLILINLPVSLSGGVLALWLAGAYLSVPATIGFIALLGIALENSLILISFLKQKTRNTEDFDRAVRESVALRLRPVLMTKFTTIIGLIPLLFSSGIGAEIQRPLAIVVMGGIFFSIFTTLLLMPVLFRRFYLHR